MSILRLIGGALCALACAVTCAAQGGQCALNAGQLREVRGLRLGMSAAELKARYPRLEAGPPDEFGQARVRLWSDQLAQVDASAFRGVFGLSLGLLDGRVVEFVLTYENLPWKDLAQFVAKTSEALGLPAAWKGDENMMTLDCDRLRLQARRASYSAGSMSPSIGFKELSAEEVVAQRAAKKKEQQIESFKP
jgi:hypothetical protein